MDIFGDIFDGPIDIDPEFERELQQNIDELPEDYLDWEDDIPF